MGNISRPAAKWIYYGTIIFICIILQNMVFPRFPIWGVKGLPIVAAVVMAALFTDAWGGGIAGFLCGIICDAMMTPGNGFFALTLMLVGIAIGLSGGNYFRKTLLTSLFLTLITLSSVVVLYYLVFFGVTGKAGIQALILVGVPQILVSTAFVVPFFPFFKATHKRFKSD
ncbi:MAG: rod shape-determining protein MreD [Oscillospiraceae bacterium]|nr:rod shape-determining protein MreD [Oscillospiraceae bacterium]